MATDSDLPTLVLRLQLGKRGDVLISLEESAEPLVTGRGGFLHRWSDPDETWGVLRRTLPVFVATWLHRWRRYEPGDGPSVSL